VGSGSVDGLFFFTLVMENRNAASQGVCASADVYEQRSLLPPRQDEGDRESAGPFIPSRLSHAFGLGFQGFSSLASPSHFTPRPADNACLHRGSAWRFAGRTVGADFFFSQTHISRCAKLLHPPPRPRQPHHTWPSPRDR
jgi:hypothetical protein